MKVRALLVGFVVLGFTLAACPKITEQPEVGGETNWLKACTDRSECGEGSCVCGVCTTECDPAKSCSGVFAGSCVNTSGRLGAGVCGGAEQVPQGLCLPRCSGDADCGAGFACRDAVCVTEPISVRFDMATQPPAEKQDSACRVEESCAEDAMCNWATARASASDCYMPFGGVYTARCGSYDGVVFQGTDSASTYYYGADGALVGRDERGLANQPGCVSYDPSFRLPASCTRTSPTCPEDAGMSDAGVSDAGTSDASTQDAAATFCDCSGETVSLACLCPLGSRQMPCRTFELATTNVVCQAGFPGRPTVERGCGNTRVNLASGLESQTFVYQGPEHTLIGASIVGDVPYGVCMTNSYRTVLPDLKPCADYSVCDLCPGGPNPCQL